MTALDTIRIRRIWNDDALLLDAAEGVTVEHAGELLAIDMTSPPESYVFEMKIYDAVKPAPAVQPIEAGFQLERVYTPPFKTRDWYAADAFSRAVAP